MRELAFLNEGIKMTVADLRNEEEVKENTNQHDEFLYEVGLEEFIKYINTNRTPIHPTIIHLKQKCENVEIHSQPGKINISEV